MPVSNFKTSAPPPPVVIPADVYQAQLIDVNEEKNSFSGKPQLAFDWVILDEGKVKSTEGKEEQLRGHRLRSWTSWIWFANPKQGRMSHLMGLACAIAGKTFTNEDGAKFNPNDLIGNQCRLTVTVNEKAGVSRNKVTGYMPIKKELKSLTEEEIEKVKPPQK